MFQARDTRLGRLVALKVLAGHGAASEFDRDRTLVEARAIAALNHPNIATIYEIADRDGAPARLDDDRTMARDGRIFGTLRSMAPECLNGWPADTLTDIYSLGMVLEEMVGAQTMPAAFHHVVERATARDRSPRFQSVPDLADRLRSG